MRINILILLLNEYLGLLIFVEACFERPLLRTSIGAAGRRIRLSEESSPIPRPCFDLLLNALLDHIVVLLVNDFEAFLQVVDHFVEIRFSVSYGSDQQVI